MRFRSVGAGVQQAGQAAELVEQLLRELQHRGALQPGAQQQRQQLGVGQRGGPRASSFSRGRASAGNVLEHGRVAGRGAS